jgi:glyoxylase I family protein
VDIPFRPHHWTLSVSNADASAAFYALFGFRTALQWTAADSSLTISHLARDDGFILELFEYTANRELEPASLDIGNDLAERGVKHMAFSVPDLAQAARAFKSYGPATEIRRGRTGISYFFVADPDGNWVEIVQDDRTLDTSQPVMLGPE